MAVGLVNNKAWFDKAFISVSPIAGSEVQLRAFTNSMSISGGDFDIDGLDTFGGKITKVGTSNDIELSFDAIPSSTRDLDWVFHGQTSSAESITASTKQQYRVTLLWTDETGITDATQAIATASEAYRQSYVEAYNISLEYNMDAGEELTASFGFKLAVEDETGDINFIKEMSPTSSALTALSAYTTSNKFR